MPSETPMSTSQNATATASDPRLPQVKAEVLRDQMLATTGLSGLNPEATLYVLAAALLAESEDGYTRDSALGILQRARKVSPDMLATAVQQVTGQLAGSMTTFWSEFIKETWQGPGAPPQYVAPNVVAQRKELEEKEQDDNRKKAVQYINHVQMAITALTIDENEFPKNAPSPVKKAPRIDVGKMVHNLIYKPAEATPAQQPTTAPGWLTPPLINKDNEAITIFDNDITEIVVNKKLAGEQAWKKLEDRGYDRQRIVQTLDAVRKTAQDQITQCDQILSFIRTDYESHIEPVVKAAVLLGHAISVVNTFYAPLPSSYQNETPNPPPSFPPTRNRGRS
ncbi:MAG: hypothetical protein WCF84_12210 [Anaerolineae bacterium]